MRIFASVTWIQLFWIRFLEYPRCFGARVQYKPVETVSVHWAHVCKMWDFNNGTIGSAGTQGEEGTIQWRLVRSRRAVFIRRAHASERGEDEQPDFKIIWLCDILRNSSLLRLKRLWLDFLKPPRSLGRRSSWSSTTSRIVCNDTFNARYQRSPEVWKNPLVFC